MCDGLCHGFVLGAQDQVSYGGLRALEFINYALSSGIEILSGRYGFPLIYDLLMNTVAFKLPPSDRPHNLGRMLFRLLLPGDFQTQRAEMSVLCILAENPTLLSHPHVPEFQIDSGMSKLMGMLHGS